MALLPSRRTGNIVRGAVYLLIGLTQLYFNRLRPSNRFTESPIYGVLLLLIAAFFFYRAAVSEGATSLFGPRQN